MDSKMDTTLKITLYIFLYQPKEMLEGQKLLIPDCQYVQKVEKLNKNVVLQTFANVRGCKDELFKNASKD